MRGRPRPAADCQCRGPPVPRNPDQDRPLALHMQARRCHNPCGLGVSMLPLQSAFGVFALLAIAWAFGENRRSVSLRQAAVGLFGTLLTPIILIQLPGVARAFRII